MVAATLTKKVLEDRRDRERERRASHGGLPRREAGWCLGVDVGTSEEGALWLALLHWLGAGSRGWVELVASDTRSRRRMARRRSGWPQTWRRTWW